AVGPPGPLASRRWDRSPRAPRGDGGRILPFRFPTGDSAMRRSLFLAAVLAASSARAAVAVYEHPALKTRLTVFTADGASAPDAVAYEGPKGFYLIGDAE